VGAWLEEGHREDAERAGGCGGGGGGGRHGVVSQAE
jgi:hypothetical protein